MSPALAAWFFTTSTTWKAPQSNQSTGQRKIRAAWRNEDAWSAREVPRLTSTRFTCLVFCLSPPLDYELQEGRDFYLSRSFLHPLCLEQCLAHGGHPLRNLLNK